jgi:hypothetical protein
MDSPAPLREERWVSSSEVNLRLRLSVFLMAAVTLIGGAAAEYGVPALAAVTAYYLYRRAPKTYVSYVWWLWFLIAFMRRISDFRSGFSESAPMLASPYIASLVCVPTLFKADGVWKKRESLPFVLALACTIFGLVVGLLALPKKFVLVSALGWFTPLIFGFFVLVQMTEDADAEGYISSLRRTFCWGTLIMGVYGIYQYYVAPGWDALWMTESGMGSIGSPEPLQLRVFSTMNGPGALAFTLLAGLILLVGQKGILPLLASGAGYAALLLSSVRAAWVAFVLAVVLLAIRERRYAGKLVIAAIVLGACLGVGMLLEPVRELVQTRILTFTDLENDTSAQERKDGYGQMMNYTAEEPLGTGLGTMDAKFDGKTSLGTRDSGIWETFLSLGWIGGSIFFGALALLAWSCWNIPVPRTPTAVAAGCISIGLLSQLPFGSVMLGASGCLIWMFGAIAMAPAKISHVLPEITHGE